MSDFESILRITVRRGLAADDTSNLPLHFEAEVLDRYRGIEGYSIIRTDTVGRLRRDGGWSIDFGIAPDETLIHVAIGDLPRIPPAERDHWAGFATALPSSQMYLQMRLAPGSCFDDGELRKW